MREISEYTLLGNYLVILSDEIGIDTIKYETSREITDAIIARVNKSNQNYLLLPMDKKMEIVKKMISKGVFRTDPSNKTTPFKQIYNYEIAKGICATYSCSGTLSFKFTKQENDNVFNLIKSSYTQNLNLDIQTALTSEIAKFTPKLKAIKIKGKE